MLFLPPHTVEAKVAALRWHLPGMNLRNFLKGMPTALARSQETVPRGLSQLRKVSRVFSYLLDTGDVCYRVEVLLYLILAKAIPPDGAP